MPTHREEQAAESQSEPEDETTDERSLQETQQGKGYGSDKGEREKLSD